MRNKQRRKKEVTAQMISSQTQAGFTLTYEFNNEHPR